MKAESTIKIPLNDKNAALIFLFFICKYKCFDSIESIEILEVDNLKFFNIKMLLDPHLNFLNFFMSVTAKTKKNVAKA